MEHRATSPLGDLRSHWQAKLNVQSCPSIPMSPLSLDMPAGSVLISPAFHITTLGNSLLTHFLPFPTKSCPIPTPCFSPCCVEFPHSSSHPTSSLQHHLSPCPSHVSTTCAMTYYNMAVSHGWKCGLRPECESQRCHSSVLARNPFPANSGFISKNSIDVYSVLSALMGISSLTVNDIIPARNLLTG